MAPTQPGCFGHTQSQRPGTPHRNSVPSLPAPPALPALPREALSAPRPGLFAQEGRREARNSFLHGALQAAPSPGRLPAPSAAAFGLQRSRSGGCSFVLEMPAGMVLSCPVCGLGKQRQQSLPAAPQPQPGSKGSTEEQAGSECPDPAPSASWTAPREGNGEKLPGKLSKVRMSRCIPVMRQSTKKALPLSLNSSTFPGDPAPRSCTGGRRGQVPTVTKQRQQGSV